MKNEKLLRMICREILLEKLTHDELKARGKPTYYSEYKFPEQSFKDWIKLAYSDDPKARDILLKGTYGGGELPEWDDAPELGIDQGDLQKARGILTRKQEEADAVAYMNQDMGSAFYGYHEVFDFPESELPEAWKEKLDDFYWKPGYGFRHRINDEPMPATNYPGLDVTGGDGDPNPFAFAALKRIEGRKTKQKFAKAYDKNKAFFDSLIYVSWMKVEEQIERMIRQPQSKDEMSATWYDSAPIKAGRAKVGLILKGRPTLVSNSNAFTGGASRSDTSSADEDQFLDAFYLGKESHRDRSSGINKYPSMEYADLVFGPKDVKQEKIESTRKYGFRKGNFLFGERPNNEALIDNWKIVGIVLPFDDTDPLVLKAIDLATEMDIPIYDADGKETTVLPDASTAGNVRGRFKRKTK